VQSAIRWEADGLVLAGEAQLTPSQETFARTPAVTGGWSAGERSLGWTQREVGGYHEITAKDGCG
jgi:hypothetical protein